jgi:hypothetical protein
VAWLVTMDSQGNNILTFHGATALPLLDCEDSYVAEAWGGSIALSLANTILTAFRGQQKQIGKIIIQGDNLPSSSSGGWKRV